MVTLDPVCIPGNVGYSVYAGPSSALCVQCVTSNRDGIMPTDPQTENRRQGQVWGGHTQEKHINHWI